MVKLPKGIRSLPYLPRLSALILHLAVIDKPPRFDENPTALIQAALISRAHLYLVTVRRYGAYEGSHGERARRLRQ